MLINLSNINKTYKTITGVTYRALSGISTSFESSGLVFLVGRSGSGKTTLMNIIGGLDSFDSGSMTIAGEPSRDMSQSKIDSFRNTVCGYIFQDFNLIETLNVFDNVRIALQMQGNNDTVKVRKILEEVGISDKAFSKVKNLSGGQRQRVAIARALIKEPKIILADEPTGALDTATGEDVMKMLKELSSSRLVIVVTHDMEKANEYGDRIIELKDGKIYRDVRKLEDGEIIEESEGVSFYGDALVKVDASHHLTDGDVDKINEAILLRGQKTFVNIDNNRNKIKALFPNLREAIEQDEVIVKKQNTSSPSPFDVTPINVDSFGLPTANNGAMASAMANISTDASEEQSIADEKFVPYKAKETVTERITYKKSRVPLTKTLQLGLNYLNHKKVMLVFSIILAVISFVLLAFSQSIASFDLSAAIASTIREEKYPSVSVQYGGGEQIKQFDIDGLKKTYPKMSFNRQYDIMLQLTGRADGNGIGMQGFVEVNDFSTLKMKMLVGEGKTIGANEIIITEHAAKALIQNWSAPMGVNMPSDLLNRQLTLQGEQVKVVGICKGEDAEGGSINTKEYTGLMRAYVAEGFLSKIVSSSELNVESNNLKIDGVAAERSSRISTIRLFNQSMAGSINNTGITNSGTLNATNEIYISRNLADWSREDAFPLDTAEGINKFNAASTELNIIGSGSLPIYMARNVQIKGIIENDASDLGFIVMSELYREQFVSSLIKSPLLLATFENSGNADGFVRGAYAAGFKVANFYESDYSVTMVGLEFVSYILIGFTTILALLVVILLYNFISTSIQLTKKQIGILRALGARKSDTFLIYVMEGLMVMLFAFVVATVLVLIFAPLFNAMISAEIGYYFSLFNIGFGAFLAIFGLALAITLLSVAINIRKFNKITPVEAINSK